MSGKNFLMGLCFVLLASGGGALFANNSAADMGWAKAQAYAPASADPVHGKSVVLTRCAVCHGADGNSTNSMYPKLAGQKPDYIYAQLQAFRSGVRKSEIMAGMVAGLSAQDANDAAAYFAAQSMHPDAVKDRKLAEEGRRIYFSSLGPGMMNECAACHGGGRQGQMPMMMGHMMGQGMAGVGIIPNIYGQHAAYILDQLNRFASGERPNNVMQSMASALNQQQRKAVAEYLSGLQ